MYKKNIALYTKIQNVKSTIPSYEKLEKDYQNHMALKSKLQIYEHQPIRQIIPTIDTQAANIQNNIDSPNKS